MIIRNLFFLLAWLTVESVSAAPRVVRYDLPTMGTVGTIAVVTADSVESSGAAATALACFARVDSLMSNWTENSEIARVNRIAPHSATVVHPEVFSVIEAAIAVFDASGGAFDPTVEPLVRAWGFLGGSPHVPTTGEIAAARDLVGGQYVSLDASTRTVGFAIEGLRLDLGGIAKGYAADRAADQLRQAGVRDALVDLSGNMVPLGAPPGRSSWRVGLRDPDAQFAYFATLLLEDDCIATSGNYEQFVAQDGEIYGHVLDPRSGEPVRGLDAVTVLAATAMQADAWATALLVMGLDEAQRLSSERQDLATVLVQSASGGRRVVWAEKELQSRLHPMQSQGDRFDLRWFGPEN